MFNGIIFNQGKVTKILKRKKGINLFIKSNILLKLKDFCHCPIIPFNTNQLFIFFLSFFKLTVCLQCKTVTYSESITCDKCKRECHWLCSQLSTYEIKLYQKNPYKPWRCDTCKENELTKQEWSLLHELLKALEPMYEATMELQGEKFTSVSKIIPLTQSLLEVYYEDDD